jgi:23S rRNA pseudouridine2457 synthase
VIKVKERFRPRSDRSYIAFNKPFAVLCQFTRPPDSAKSTLDDFGFPKGVYPVGRLDYDSEGLLLLSDDAALNDALLNPKWAHERIYLAQVENVPAAEALSRLAKGVVIEQYMTAPARVTLLENEPELPPREIPIRFRKNIPTAWVQLALTEGRNRQVRKMTASVGHPTLRLVRIAIGALSLFDLGLSPGEWRKLSLKEIELCCQN